MDNSFQSSFIPKKPMVSSGNLKKPPKSVTLIVTSLLLFLVGAGSGALYAYKNYLNNQKKNLSISLGEIKQTFKKETIEELEAYDDRIKTAKEILNGHLVLSPLFELVGELTIPEIQLTKFNHEMAPEGFKVEMSGIATNYKSIALQDDAFSNIEGDLFKNVVFSNLVKTKDNRIGFDVAFIVNPSLLSYQNTIAKENSDKAPEIIEPTAPAEITTPAPTTNEPIIQPQ